MNVFGKRVRMDAQNIDENDGISKGRKRPLESIENNINSADLVGQTDLQRGRRQCRRLFSPQQKVFASYTST